MPVMQSPICCQERLLKELSVDDATLNAMLMSKAFYLDLSAIDCLEDESSLNKSGSQENNNLEQQLEQFSLNESGSQENNNLEQQLEQFPLNESGTQENNNLEEETHETR